MYIFQSEQVIKLRFWQKITSLLFKSYLHIYLIFTHLIFFDISTSIHQWTVRMIAYALGDRMEEERQCEPSVNWTRKVCSTSDGVCRSLLCMERANFTL